MSSAPTLSYFPLVTMHREERGEAQLLQTPSIKHQQYFELKVEVEVWF